MILLQELSSDPVAIFECSLLLITALYILRLTFAGSEQAVSHFSAKQSFINLFAVGQTVTVSKRSLTHQRVLN